MYFLNLRSVFCSFVQFTDTQILNSVSRSLILFAMNLRNKTCIWIFYCRDELRWYIIYVYGKIQYVFVAIAYKDVGKYIGVNQRIKIINPDILYAIYHLSNLLFHYYKLMLSIYLLKKKKKIVFIVKKKICIPIDVE